MSSSTLAAVSGWVVAALGLIGRLIRPRPSSLDELRGIIETMALEIERVRKVQTECERERAEDRGRLAEMRTELVRLRSELEVRAPPPTG